MRGEVLFPSVRIPVNVTADSDDRDRPPIRGGQRHDSGIVTADSGDRDRLFSEGVRSLRAVFNLR